MDYHQRLIELSQKSELTSQECLEIVKKTKKSSLPFGPLLLDAVLALQQRGQLVNDTATHVLKSINSPEEAVKYSQSLMKENLADDEAMKDKISMVKFKDGYSKNLVGELNAYLEQNPSDKEAWIELADLYMKFFDFKKALYCYEEILLLFPDNIHIVNRIAEVNYSIGGKTNLGYAKKYFSFVITSQRENVRAFWGLINTIKALDLLKAATEEDKELLSLCQKRLTELYTNKGMADYIK